MRRNIASRQMVCFFNSLFRLLTLREGRVLQLYIPETGWRRFKDEDLYKTGLCGHAIYISSETDTVFVNFATTWQNSLSMLSHARAIGKQLYRTQ